MINFPTSADKSMQYKLAHGFFYLGSMSEVAPVVGFLKSELNRLDNENRSERDDSTFRQRQGACQTIGAILDEIEMADQRAKDMGKVVF